MTKLEALKAAISGIRNRQDWRKVDWEICDAQANLDLDVDEVVTLTCTMNAILANIPLPAVRLFKVTYLSNIGTEWEDEVYSLLYASETEEKVAAITAGHTYHRIQDVSMHYADDITFAEYRV